MITKFNKFNNSKTLNEMAAPRIPNSEEYWKEKGKVGKEVWIYTHDDLDGLFSGIAIKKYLLSKGFEIKGYGIVNYQESWKVAPINTKYINVAVDFADFHPDIDVYIDHHGDFKDPEEVKEQPAIKTKTGSAYEGIMDQLGLPVDALVLYVIDMVDSAKYDFYGVKWTDLLNWDIDYIKSQPKSKLLFAGIFNQMIKRGDHRTLVEVIHNATEPSVYQILSLFRYLFPANNVDWRSGHEQEFFQSGVDRLEQVKTRSRGTLEYKDIITSQEQFKELFTTTEDLPIMIDYEKLLDLVGGEDNLPKFYKDVDPNEKVKKPLIDEYTGEVEKHRNGRIKFDTLPHEFIKMNGYCVIGDLVYMPTGTWSNPIRARAVVQQDIESGALRATMDDIKWVFLVYGDTLQIVSFGKIYQGSDVQNLKDYCDETLQYFKDKFDYHGTEDTTSGGHIGIGTISNIGTSEYSIANIKEGEDTNKFVGLRYLDMFRNKIISDLSGIKWKLDFEWIRSLKRSEPPYKPIPKGARMMAVNQIRTINPRASMTVSYPPDYERKPSIKELQDKAQEEKLEKERLEKEKIEAEVQKAKEKHNRYARPKEYETDESQEDDDKEKTI